MATAKRGSAINNNQARRPSGWRLCFRLKGRASRRNVRTTVQRASGRQSHTSDRRVAPDERVHRKDAGSREQSDSCVEKKVLLLT